MEQVMIPEIADSQIRAMSVDERLELIDRLWDSLNELDSDGHILSLMPEQEQELDRRVDLLEAGQLVSSPMPEVFERLRSRT